jgi:Cu/Ag efflux pump CusA
MINRIIRYALEHRLLTIFLAALASLIGIFTAMRMPKDIYPDLSPPVVTIVTENEGMAAEDVERLISFPLESLLNGAPHVIRVRSESATGGSVVTVEFSWGTDIYLARQIVSSKLEIVTGSLPQGTEGPHLGPVSSRMGEVFEFAVVGETDDPLELRSIADWTIRYRLQGVPGVSYVINFGGFVKQFQVFLKPEMLKHYCITTNDVQEAIEKSNRNFSGGLLARGSQEELIKGLGRIADIEDIINTVVASRENIPVFVGDVADVRVGGKFRRDDASYNGEPAVSVTVQKQYGGSTLAAIERVKEALAEIRADLPGVLRSVPSHREIHQPREPIHHRGNHTDPVDHGGFSLGHQSLADLRPHHPPLHPHCPDRSGALRGRFDGHVHGRARHRRWKSGERHDHHGGKHRQGPQRTERGGLDTGVDL